MGANDVVAERNKGLIWALTAFDLGLSAGFTREVPAVECYACLGNCEFPLALREAVISKPKGVIAERV